MPDNTCVNCGGYHIRTLADSRLMCDVCGWTWDADWSEADDPPPAVTLNKKYADDPTVFKIPDVNLANLHDRIIWLNKRAGKLGADPIAITDLEKVTERVKQDEFGLRFKIIHYTFVRVQGEPIKLDGGWTFAATLEHTEAGNIIRAVPGQDIPVIYRDAEPTCNHCKLDRNRKDTYLVTNDAGLFMQVGRQCLKDFVGHRDPSRIAAWLQHIAELAGYIEDEFMTGNIQPTGVDAELFLGLVAACIRLWGWISSGKAQASYISSTKNDAVGWLDAMGKGRVRGENNELLDKNGHQEHTRNGKPVETTPDDFALGRASLNWARNQTDADIGASGYLYNLKVVAQLDGFLWKQTGLAASMVQAYQRYLGETLKRLDAPESNYQGEVKKRSHWPGLLCTHVYDWEGRYGMTHLHKFTDQAGNVFIWKTGVDRLDVGCTYAGKATVKAHEEYEDVKQTVITRFAWEEIDVDRPIDGNGE
jgi:hypothetical protein